MAKGKPKKRPVRTGLRAAAKAGGPRRAKFQAWRYTDGKKAPITTRRIDTNEEEQT